MHHFLRGNIDLSKGNQLIGQRFISIFGVLSFRKA